jgi:acetoin utilization protein AcuB
MTLAPQVIDLSSSLTEARKMMDNLGVRHLPVVKNGKAISVLSKRELEAALALQTEQTLSVADVCAIEMYAVDQSTTLAEVLRAMAESRINSVVVTSAEQVTGIFTSSDACQFFSDLLRGY